MALNAMQRRVVERLKVKRIIHLTAAKNNTFLNLTNGMGEPILVKSMGHFGYHGGQKKLALNSWNVGFEFGKLVREKEPRADGYELHLHGWGQRKVMTIQGLRKAGVQFSSIIDKTSLPHGGCRPKKARRL